VGRLKERIKEGKYERGVTYSCMKCNIETVLRKWIGRIKEKLGGGECN
jgi:hypothetical protein